MWTPLTVSYTNCSSTKSSPESLDKLLERSAVFRNIMTAVVDHFNVFIVCAIESELQATKGVLENGTGSKFENKYLGVEGLSQSLS